MLKFFLILSCFACVNASELPQGGFFTEGKLLYLQAREGGLSFAIESASHGNLANGAKIENPEFEWDFGFNVGLGYRIPHDRWQLLLQFTSFQTHNDANKKAKSRYVFFPIWLSSVSPNNLYASEVKEHWRLHLGLLDALLSRPFLATKTITLIPQVGVRYGSARQKFNLEYRGGNFSQEIEVRMKNKFWGLGPYAGLTCEYGFAKNFCLFAKGAASLLYGEFYLHQVEEKGKALKKLLRVHSIYRSTPAILEGSAGIRMHHYSTGAFKRLTFDLAWDQMLFFSQNQLIRFVDGVQKGGIMSNQGDLSTSGFHFSAAIDF